MYDTVHFYVGDSITDFTTLAKHLSNVLYTSDENGVLLCAKGYIGSLYVELHLGWMMCRNSLSRFYFGNNVQRMNLQQIKEAIEKLSDMLHYDACMLNVTRVDIADCFSMNRPVAEYFSCLGELSRFKRIDTVKSETLTYRQGNEKYGRSLVFYDKRKEMADTLSESLEKMEMPNNLLRYEARYYGKLATRFKEPAITGATLYDETFFRKLVQLWYDSYCQIEKQMSVSYNGMDSIKNVKDAKEYILIAALAQLPATFIPDMIRQFKQHRVFRNSSEYTRLHKEIYEVLHNPLMTNDSELITELNGKVRQTYDEMIGIKNQGLT